MTFKHTIHIDMSGNLCKVETVGVSFVSVTDPLFHKGCAISKDILRSLINVHGLDFDYPRLYAIIIYLIIKDDLDVINNIIICDDQPFNYVRDNLDLLFFGNSNYDCIKVEPLGSIREKMGKNIKSKAHGKSNSYRKRALKIRKHNIGSKLNIVDVSYKQISDLWYKINKEKLNGES